MSVVSGSMTGALIHTVLHRVHGGAHTSLNSHAPSSLPSSTQPGSPSFLMMACQSRPHACASAVNPLQRLRNPPSGPALRAL
jgi:hypothetical protein